MQRTKSLREVSFKTRQLKLQRMKMMMRTIVELVIMEKVSWSLSCTVGTRR